MSKSNMAEMVRGVKMAVSKHSPEILTGLGIAGMVMTTVLAVRATPKALELIKEKKDELEIEQEEKLPAVETVKATWKCYVPAVVTGATSVACLIGASSVNLRRNAALTAAYNLSTTALAEYKEKVIETVGVKKERDIRDKVSEERIKKNPVNQSAIIVTGKGTTRCFDTITKRRFMSDIEELKKIAEEKGVKAGAVMWAVRIGVSGLSVTPGGATELMEILGKDESLNRLNKSLEKLKN